MDFSNRRSETVMYLGPYKKGIVTFGTVFNHGIPVVLREEIKKNPVLAELLVPLNKVAEARKELSIAGSRMQILYEKAKG